MSLIPYKRNLEVEKKVLEELLSGAIPLPVGDGLISKMGDKRYSLTNLKHGGKVVPVLEFTTVPFDNGSSKTQDQWFVFSGVSTKKGECGVPDVECFYQILRRCYEQRANKACEVVVQACVGELRAAFDESSYLVLTKVVYGAGFDAVVSHRALFPKSNKPKTIQVPEFERFNDDWSYFVLAKEQSENKLGTVEQISQNARPILEALLGGGYEKAGAVFQYCASRKNNGNLREVRLWVPTASNRNAERVVVLGVSNYGDGFDLGAGGGIYVGRPAFGVREQKIVP